MKKSLLILAVASFLMVACADEPKITPQEQKQVEDQVAKDQAAQDSMDAVIMEQIELIQVTH
jgi:uncharacterized protein YcfL